MKKIVLANALLHSGNRGCVALTLSVLSIIDDLFKSRSVDYEVFLPDSQIKKNGYVDLTVGDKKLRVYSCSYYKGYDLRSWGKYLAYGMIDKTLAENRRIFGEADFILDIGQGDSFSDIYGLERFRKIDHVHTIARRKNIPYALLPQTIGPFKDKDVLKSAKKSIENARLCMARDEESYEYARQISPSARLHTSVDVAFFLPYQKQSFDPHKTHVGLNVSSLLWHGGYSSDNQFGLVVDYPRLINSIIAYFSAMDDVVLHLIPHVVMEEDDVENDYSLCYRLFKQMDKPNVVLSPFFMSPCDAKSYISGMDFFMGARMHSTIAAFSSGVPVVPMSYSRKFEGLFEKTLDYPYWVDMKEMNNEEAFDFVVDSFEHRCDLKLSVDSCNSEKIDLFRQSMQNVLSEFFNI